MPLSAARAQSLTCHALLLASGLALWACEENAPEARPAQISSAETILDAFYEWNGEARERGRGSADGVEAMRSNQRWAEAAHYEVQKRRPCRQATVSRVVCDVTVTDDFGSTLGYTATDTFTFDFEPSGHLSRIEFEGDDPPVFLALWAWIALFRGEVLDSECKDLFAGGPTPAACARSVVAAARDFVAWSPFH